MPLEKIRTEMKSMLRKYHQLLMDNIQQYGFVPEFLNDAQSVDFKTTRALCQTRGIFYLVTYARLFKHHPSIDTAIALYRRLKQDYWHPKKHNWCELPGQKITDNLYEYAFLLFAFSHLYQAKPFEMLETDIADLHQIIQSKFIDKDFSTLKDQQGRLCQNAIMHLFEAYLAAFVATKNRQYKETAEAVFQKIVCEFYDPEKQLIAEYSPVSSSIYEPGHSFEWCSLMNRAEHHGLKLTPETPQKLVDPDQMAKAARMLGTLKNGLIKPTLDADTKTATYRIWPILEQLRYYALTKVQNDFERTYSIFSGHYIANDLPVEYVDVDGKPAFNKVKATTGYHLINAFSPLFEAAFCE